MTTSVHANLTGSDLHEPKGAATALSGEVYVSDGAGSGVWTPASNVITNSAFTTADLKLTHKGVADTGWILWIEGTIGDGSSSATVRANADTAALFTFYWNNFGSTNCPISGGYGVSAAADFAAHKALSLPKGAGRALGVAGSGAGLTSRGLGTLVGEETHLLALSETPSNIVSGGTIIVNPNGSTGLFTPFVAGGGGGNTGFLPTVSTTTTVPTSGALGWSYTNSFSSTINTLTSGNTGGQVHNNMQPTVFVNTMIKL